MGKVIRLSKRQENLIKAIRSEYYDLLKENGIEYLLTDEQSIIEQALIQMLQKRNPDKLREIMMRCCESRDF